jgi:hypothetical protein
MRSSLEDRALWPMYPVEHSFRSRGVPMDNLVVPGLPQQANATGWDPWAGVSEARPVSLQPAYGVFYDSTPVVAFGGGPGAGCGVTGIWSGIVELVRLDPGRRAEGMPGVAPMLDGSPNPSMAYQTPPTFGDLAYKIPAGVV